MDRNDLRVFLQAALFYGVIQVAVYAPREHVAAISTALLLSLLTEFMRGLK